MSGAKSLTGQPRTAGWALVNVHLGALMARWRAQREYPISRYKSSLEYVKPRYNGAFWNKTPREEPQFCACAVNDLAVNKA
jgi:hypothetical protein